MRTKNLFWAALACTALFTACKDDEKDEIIPVSFSEFGLYAEDNSDFLKTDYVAEDLTGTAISFTLPYGTDPDAVKALAPRFVATEGAAVNVADETGAPSGDALVSGASTVDFSSDVTLVISLKNNYKAYTVSVKIAEPAKWTQVASSAVDMKRDPVLAINPVDGVPYVAGAVKDDTYDSYPVLLKLEESELKDVAGYLSNGSANYMSISFNPSGVPYVSYYNGSKYPEDATAALNKQTVMKVESGTASYVGDPTAMLKTTGSSTSSVALFVLADDDIWCAHYANNAGSVITKRAVNLCHFDGSAWTTEMSLSGRTMTDYAYNITGKVIGGVPYMYIFNQNTNSNSLYKLVSGSWETVFESLKFKMIDGTADIDKQYITAQDFDIASDGGIYVMTGADYITTGVYNLGVVRIDPADFSQTIVGGVYEGADMSKIKVASFDLDANDVPYLAMTLSDGTVKRPCLMYIDSETKSWSEPEYLSQDAANYITIRFAEDGKGYVVVKENTDTSSKYVLYTNE